MKNRAIIFIACGLVLMLTNIQTSSVEAVDLVGEGPSLLDETHREGTVVHPAILSSPDAKLFRPRMIWADSWQFVSLPILDNNGTIQAETDQTQSISAADRIMSFIKVEQWYNSQPPQLDGKYVLIEFSASWCPACKRAAPQMERWNEKFKDKLVIISIFETDKAQMDNFPEPGRGESLKHCIGIDTKRRSAAALGVYGIPHSVIVEPQYGAVVWEGMTEQKGYELTDEIIEKILAVGEKDK